MAAQAKTKPWICFVTDFNFYFQMHSLHCSLSLFLSLSLSLTHTHIHTHTHTNTHTQTDTQTHTHTRLRLGRLPHTAQRPATGLMFFDRLSLSLSLSLSLFTYMLEMSNYLASQCNSHKT